eukprot:1974622-Pyramimonas_sp.AAC.1
MEQRLADSRKERDKLLQRLPRELDKHDKWQEQLREHENHLRELRAELEIMDAQHAELAIKLATGPPAQTAPNRISLQDL